MRGSGRFALSAIALVTEKGDLCDHTHAADARGSRTPQLCRINHPKLSAHSRGFSAVRSEAARSSGTGRHPALPGLPTGRAQARYRNGIELCCRPPVLLREDAEAPFRERGFALPARGEAQTAPADHPEPGRSRPADRLIQKSLPLRHASDDLLDGAASKRTLPAQSRQHRQPANDAARRARQGRRGPRGSHQSETG